ncbi:uncharacterized protein EV420DRAFT_1566016 [Desarmillaria tabescens]|uniref:DUF6697 domain-containing protein n=1 Tax=Armillaria tabescens TaxID=1929756 RepID=A0AA39MWL1_ARMTA|nr:uncharacterized protein EV420DRAFT_1566016 [Desarmillaria tabescens]KAK0448893.1 hypothetical protein EV420DRAFT_1566016 [Desarmillaria tabescens]
MRPPKRTRNAHSIVESIEPEPDAMEPQRDYDVYPGAMKLRTQLDRPEEVVLKSEDEFDPSDSLSVDDGFEDASRSEKRQVGSGSTSRSHLSEIARGKKKAVPRPLNDNYLAQIESIHLKNAKQYTTKPPPPTGFYVPRVFVSSVYGGSSMQFMQKLTAFDIQCIWPTKDLNPLVVDSPGAPGLLFTSRPEIVGGKPWHVFCKWQVEKQLRWEYAGKYTMVISGKIKAEQLAAQTEATKKRWGEYLITRKEARVYVAMRARIALRKHDQPLDERRVCMEIEAVTGRAVEKPGDKRMTKEDKQKERGKIKARVPLAVTAKDVIEALCNGDEHINILRMDCIGYDHTFVKDMQKKLPQWQSKSKSTPKNKSASAGKGKLPLRPDDGNEQHTSSVAPRRRTSRRMKNSVRSRQLADEEVESEVVESEDERDDSNADPDY